MNKFITLSHLRRVVSAITNRFKSLENTVEDIEETKADISYVDSKPRVMKVTITMDDNNEYSADRTFSEIYAHIQNGGNAYAIDGATIFPLTTLSESTAFFVSQTTDSANHMVGSAGFAIANNEVEYFDNASHYVESVRLNDFDSVAPSFYAPTTAGTSGQVLTSSGSGAPTWSNISTPSAATATPLMDGTATVGSSSKYAKEDHAHPSDTSKLNASASAGKGSQSTSYTTDYRYWKIRTSNSGGDIESNYIQGYNTGADKGIKLHVSTGSSSSKVENILTMTSTSTNISKIPTPTEDTDAANKKYVDDSISGFSSSLSGLTDTTISSVTNGQVLTYDSTNSVWVNEDAPSEVFLVTISADQTSSTGYRSDKTYSQIVEAVNAGKLVIGTHAGGYFSSYSIVASTGYVQFIYNRQTQIRQYNISSSSTEVAFSSRNIAATNTTYTLSMTNNVITLTGSDGSTSSVTLPVYGGEVDEVLG